jgi:hypothetical protein
MKKTRRESPSTNCVFCGKPVKGGEHIWPNWIEKDNLFPLAAHHKLMGFAPRKEQQRLHRKEVRCTCERDCNNGWISQLNEKAKAVTKALALGQSIKLNAKDQQLFAAQAALMTIVAEWDVPSNAAVTLAQRQELMISTKQGNPKPPLGMYVWIGHRMLDRKYPTSRTRSFWPLPSSPGHGFDPPLMPAGAQLSHFSIGKVQLVVFASERMFAGNSGGGVRQLDEMAGMPRLPLLMIWPVKIDNYPWPPIPLYGFAEDAEVKRVFSAMIGAMAHSFHNWPRERW